MDEEGVRALIRQRFPQVGGRKKFARQAGVSEARVSQFMRGHTGPGPQILDALGLETSEVFYREKCSCTNELKGA